MKKILMKGGFIMLMTALALLTGCLSYSVESVEVSIDGNASSIDAGNTIKFNFLVTATGKDTSQAQRVRWSVSSTSDGKGPVTPGTTVSPNGTLAVSIDEIYPILYVRASHDSFAYGGKYDYKQIQVKGPKVGSVILSSDATLVVAGRTVKLSAFVAGKAPNQDLTYSVGSKNDGTGAVVAGTAIAADGTLTVAAAETAASLYVRAVSDSDKTKFDTKEIKIITVTSVTVSADGGKARVLRGSSLKFNAAVAGNNNPDQNVTWKVSSNAAGTGAVTAGTAINANGTLTVAGAEAAATLYVIATSALDPAKSGSITVVIPTVTSITVSPVNPQIKRGEGATFTARVQGIGDPGQDVTWKLDGVGGSTTVTTITANGMLIVNTAETLSGLIVTATSVDDPTKFGTTMVTIPAVPAAIVIAPPTPTPAPQTTTTTPAAGGTGPYIITGSGTTFTATRNGATIGTAGQPIQNVINDIRTNANGAACAIQFGDGTAVLDMGTTHVTLTNTNSETWGGITLSGKITSNESLSSTILVSNRVSVTSNANIEAKAWNSSAVGFNSTGVLTITGGTVQATSASAVNIGSAGTVNITGGTLQVSQGNAVTITSTGTVNITGGTIQATMDSGTAIRSYGSPGKIIVSGTARVTSVNTNADGGTIKMFKPQPDPTTLRLEITGGTVENTANGGNAIYNASAGAISITGGTVRATGTGYAVNNNSTGVVTIGAGATITGQRKLTP